MKKHKGRWRVSVHIHGHRMEKYFANRTDALEWKSEKTRERDRVNAGLDVVQGIMTLHDFCADWMKSRVVNKGASTWKQDETKLRTKILPLFGVRPIAGISIEAWENFLDSLLREGASPAYRNRYRALLHKLYKDALRRRIVKFNPISGIPLMPESREIEFIKSAEDVADYLDAAKHVTAWGPQGWFYRLAVLLVNAGPRVMEAIALTGEDFDFENRTIRINKIIERVSGELKIRTKGGGSRLIPMNEVIYRSFKGIRKGPIFQNDGVYIGHRVAYDTHLRCMKLAGLEPMSIHKLRHTFGSHYRMNGGTASELKVILGHSTEAMTEKYSHMAEEHLLSRINVISFQGGTREKRGKSKRKTAKTTKGVV